MGLESIYPDIYSRIIGCHIKETGARLDFVVEEKMTAEEKVKLKIELEKGRRIDITVKGFASPLAKTDYNVNLTQRRISSLENYLSEYENGALLPYLKDEANNKGALFISRIPFGEYTAEKFISDNPNDAKNSIYSRIAARERKIEIQSVSFLTDSSENKLEVNQQIHDFGSVSESDTLTFDFIVKNNSKESIEILKIESECACVIGKTSKNVLLPNEETHIHFQLIPKGFKGKLVKSVLIETNKTEKLQLIGTAEVEK